jgi:CRP-like cAMP-binding protein
MYLLQGSVKLSVLSKTGKEAIVAMLSPGDFFGEGCLAGQSRRMASATAVSAATVLAQLPRFSDDDAVFSTS